ncbi:thiamine ABC transporter substrate binding subunit [Mesobacterium sp. TK19101]|uniref:Thiamine ABC transporter substrate binding subunit n=1 Tax=Mesobacterium hydrothermale TaxID=3111907 RepID=A0ABU6HEU0_9RHOB|nr:thiamine ABC transporter substrate binding subunit [Mesobacterium sp. TK19101]MEC3860896.1 thiamine ABC transporter substrate binding subunit [Mesobacterium sp. TK19101]
MKALTFAAGLFTASTALAQTPVLTVYAPDYFTSDWGPGPAIEAAFEAQCGCDLQFKPGDLLPRLLLEGNRTEADVVIGLNTDVTKKARDSGLFAPHGQDTGALTLPIDWTDDVFLPFDWSYVSFVYDTTRLDTPPTSFEALAAAPDDLKVIIQDPRSSISGLALVLWVKAVYGDRSEEIWAGVAPHILTVTKGWSEAYGLFTDGEAPMVLSFTTSPAYHIAAEGDDTKKAAIFDEGHYAFFELVAKVAGTDQPELADAFMAFVLSDTFQKIIPETNWSYPSALPKADWPQVFQDLPAPAKAIFLDEDQSAALRDEAIEEWRRALSQ